VFRAGIDGAQVCGGWVNGAVVTLEPRLVPLSLTLGNTALLELRQTRQAAAAAFAEPGGARGEVGHDQAACLGRHP